jgi:hypothetical protein
VVSFQDTRDDLGGDHSTERAVLKIEGVGLLGEMMGNKNKGVVEVIHHKHGKLGWFSYGPPGFRGEEEVRGIVFRILDVLLIDLVHLERVDVREHVLPEIIVVGGIELIDKPPDAGRKIRHRLGLEKFIIYFVANK